MTDLEVTSKLNELKLTFVNGKYWVHNKQYENDVMSVKDVEEKHDYSSCPITGKCGCNFFGDAIQCHGFAKYIASLVFGSYPNVSGSESAANGTDKGNGWKLYTSQYFSNLKLAPGDFIRSAGHSAIVWKVNGDKVDVGEALGTEGSRIHWGGFNGASEGSTSMTTLMKSLLYIVKAPKTSTVKVKVTFDANGGVASDTSREYIKGSAYGSLPTATRSGYKFLGWWPEKYINSEEYAITKIVPVGYEHKLYAQWGSKYKIRNVQSGKYLNINGSNLSKLDNGREVNLWDNTGSKEQIWLIPDIGSRRIISSFVDRKFGLNVKRLGTPYKCNIHRIFQNETDAVISIFPDGNKYKIKLYNYDLYLTAASSDNGAAVYWSANTLNNYQRWDILPT